MIKKKKSVVLVYVEKKNCSETSFRRCCESQPTAQSLKRSTVELDKCSVVEYDHFRLLTHFLRGVVGFVRSKKRGNLFGLGELHFSLISLRAKKFPPHSAPVISLCWLRGGVFRPTQSHVLILSPGRNPCEPQPCLTSLDRSKRTSFLSPTRG